VTARPRLLLFALLAWLLGRAGAGLLACVQELCSTDPGRLVAALTAGEDERLARTLAEQDRQQDLPVGYHLELIRALWEHVPPAGVIYVRQRPGRIGWPGRRTLPALHHLAAPRLFRPPPDELGGAPSADGSNAVLDFDDELRARLETRRTPVARGPDWTLWR
jgi:hypothetical protein